jgi:hypothetical protein
MQLLQCSTCEGGDEEGGASCVKVGSARTAAAGASGVSGSLEMPRNSSDRHAPSRERSCGTCCVDGG